MAEKAIGCGRPTGSVVGEEPSPEKNTASGAGQEEVGKESDMAQIMVGRKAPDFVAPAYHKGGFTQIKLSDYLGKWVLLCFYPGDFTFV